MDISTDTLKKLIIMFTAVILQNCMPVKVSTTKLYRISDVQKFGERSQVRIQGLPGYFMLNSDTLKVNDSIEITVLKRNRKNK